METKMETKSYLILFLLASILLCGCTNSNNTSNKGGFHPTEPGVSDIEVRLPETGMFENSIKLSIWVQKVSDKLPNQAVNVLETKMLQIAVKNGVSGYGGDPSFVFAVLVNPLSSGVTTSAPVKKTINYQIAFYVANLITGDVFGMCTQEIMGVGDTFDLAALNAMSSIKDNGQIKSMIRESSNKIISWYNNNSESFISKVKECCMAGDYAKAYALLSSVPKEATDCFEYAQTHKDNIYQNYILTLSAEYFARMQDAIAKAGTDYDATVGAYLNMIPKSSPYYESASTKYDQYMLYVRDVANEKRIHEMRMEEESKAAERLRLETEMAASESLMAQQEMPSSDEDANEGSIVETILSQAVQLGVDKLFSFFLI